MSMILRTSLGVHERNDGSDDIAWTMTGGGDTPAVWARMSSYFAWEERSETVGRVTGGTGQIAVSAEQRRQRWKGGKVDKGGTQLEMKWKVVGDAERGDTRHLTKFKCWLWSCIPNSVDLIWEVDSSLWGYTL